MSQAESQRLSTVGKSAYDTTANSREDGGAVNNNSLDHPLVRQDSGTNVNNVVYQFDVVDAAGLIAGSQEAEEHKRLVDRVAQVDFLHKVFFYLSIPSFVAALVVAIVLYTTKQIEANTASKGVAIECTIATIILSTFLIYCHLTAYTNPPQQRMICRILLMAPIYAIDSLIGLFRYKEGSLAAIVRDTYEAYVIYVFYRLLLDYLGSEQRVLELWAEFKPDGIDHLFPMNIIFWKQKCPLNQRTLNYIKICLIQYMILRPLLTLITIPLFFTGHYKEGDFDVKGNAYIYFAIIQNASVFFGFSALVYFYFACKEFLEPYAPGMKFIVVKAVVFLCFWQGIVIAVFHHFDLIPHSQLWTSDDVAMGLQNFLVCIEMFLVAIAHRWIFPDTPYMPLDGRMKLRSWQVLHLFSISDVVDEARSTVSTAHTVFVDHAKEIHTERKLNSSSKKGSSSTTKSMTSLNSTSVSDSSAASSPTNGADGVVVGDEGAGGEVGGVSLYDE